MAPDRAAGRLAIHRSAFGREAGLILVKTAREIDDPAVQPGTGSRLDIALAALLALLGVAPFVYLSHAITGG